MIVLLIVGLLSSAYSSDSNIKDEFRNRERRIAGGGNFGGFIGLTTYPAGAFLVKGKYERHSSTDGMEEKVGDLKFNTEGYDPELTGKVGYLDEQTDQLYRNQIFKDSTSQDDEYIEYLGYRGSLGNCIGKYGEKYENQNSYEYKNGQNQRNDSIFNQAMNKRCDKLFGYTGPTANDEPENLIRPCALADWQCIRKYFAANSNCKPAYGPIPDPLYLDVTTGFFPNVNVTIAAPNFMLRGLGSAKISEFYVNRRTGNLVIALNIAVLNETVPRAYFRYRRTAKESIVLADYFTNSFRGVIMTAIIPKIPHLRLDLADIHPYVQDSTPRFFVGPGAFNSTDPDVVSAFTQFNLLLPTTIRESQVFRAQLFTSIYIQKNICDFGLALISV